LTLSELKVNFQYNSEGKMVEDKEHNFFGLNLIDFINCIEQGVVSENHEGIIVYANQKLLDMLEYSAQELIGKHWTEIVAKEERPQVEPLVRKRVKGEKSRYETQIMTKSGRKFPVIVCGRPVFQSGQYLGSILTFTDIAASKQTEHEIKSKSERFEMMNRALNLQRKKLVELTEQLERANIELKGLSEAKSNFVSAVSHDLRTPLTTIIEGISLVEDGTLGEVNEEQKKFLKLAIEDAERLNDFINDILDLAKIEAGKIVVKKTKVDPKEQIERLKKSYENYARDKGLELFVELPAEEVSVLADAGHYYRVLTNFISNAIKFTFAGGKIKIRVEKQKGDLVLTSVQDTGVGIAPENKPQIFQKFEQVEQNKRQLGSGLGLALCKELVELNGGKIGFRSEVNKGSNFYFSLPVYDEINDFTYMLETVNQRAKTISGHAVVFLFRVGKESKTDIETTLKKIEDEIQLKILGYDLLKVFSGRKEIALVSAIPEESAQPTFTDLVETVRKVAGNKISAGFYVCPDVLPEARTVLQILEGKMESIK
jgi:PAS domain S-box-containing protein